MLFAPTNSPRWRRALLAAAVLLVLVSGLSGAQAFAQSTAANGAIEGTVVDNSGGVLPGVTVTVVNTDTGTNRSVVTNEAGLYRATLLPLGTYRVSAELQGFKKFEQVGVTVGAGQTATVNVRLEVGDLNETISVTADAPVVDTAKVDAGRNLNENEIKNLPLVSRNPYNFALLQPGVTGFENSEFGVPRFAANGTLLRINYQIDGNTNTQKDRAGLRLLPVSEVMVREVKVVTSGYAPEFGQTTGLVYNAITPSGTNQFRGAGAYRFRRKSFSAFPFYFQGARTDDRRPDTKVDTVTAELGGPILKDKLHFFTGFENTYRDLSAQSVITATPENVARLGIAAQPGVVPREQTARFFIGKVDYQLAQNHRATARTIIFRNDSPNNIGGALTTLERTTDFLDAMESTSGQLVSSFGSSILNEFRVQYARRVQGREANDLSGTGPAINIPGVANFGGPIATASDAGFGFTQGIFQVVNNFTYIRGNHSYKFGGDIQLINDERTATLLQLYTFPSIDAYLAARNGTNPRSYTNYQQLIGNPDFSMKSSGYSFFVQDDWRVTPNLKFIYGLRYDYYNYPEGDPSAPFAFSQSYADDTNNVGPRFGLAYSFGADKRQVIRASSGIMYDQMLLGAYETAIQANGNPERINVTLAGNAANAPAFPGSLADLPPGFVLPRQSITTVDPDFQVARTWQNNVQYERAFGQNYYGSVGYTFVQGDLLPVIVNINPINPISSLGDGRPVFSSAVNATTRLDPRFNQINVVQSAGDSTYNALMLQFGKRLSGGIQFDVNYTLGKGTDNAPLTTALSVQGDDGVSDPTNLDRDRGPNLLDTRHTFAGSVILQPTFAVDGLVGAIVNGNQLGLMMQFNSGLPLNLRSATDLNGDGVLADRPLFVGRNSLYLPARYNVDARFSRFIPFGGTRRLEIAAEFKNLFNTVQTSAVNRIIPTNAFGEPTVALPSSSDQLQPTAGYEQRQFQLGFKFYF
ncbi:TonB-dependent receptor [Luteitalea sp.]|uniref:TonB-dependent receptor n=1 Tax=Luteitalea sp. TaxID=2004800 RepID=UPI0025B8C532|nr:TonB-dependent receptor [Luteitalea sp.]